MVLLRVFQAWQNAHVNNIAEEYCLENCLNNELLESITNARIMILGHLRACGFVRAKGPGDIKDLNVYADHWGVIKAALTAGLYPNVAAKLENNLCVHQGSATKVSILVFLSDKRPISQTVHGSYVILSRSESFW